MKKKWIVIHLLLVLGAVGALAATPTGMRFWEQHHPWREVVFDRAMRTEVIDTLVAKLNAHYVFPDKARRIEAVVRHRQQAGKYDGITNGFRLASQLSADLNGVARDLHMKVWFMPGLDMPDESVEPPATPAQWEQSHNLVERFIMRYQAGREVKGIERLNGNIGYLKITSFPDAYLMTDRFAAAMDELADTDGLILDLRRNDGGDPQAVALLISYFVDRRTRLNDLFDRDSGKTIQHWTHDRLDGKRYGGKKPIYILAGPRTGSAGEDFVYTMQALKRATVVGERTWGGAHPTRAYRLGWDFVVTIPSQRSISPITGSNWEGTGIIPDIAARQVRALAVAHKLLRQRLHESAAAPASRRVALSYTPTIETALVFR